MLFWLLVLAVPLCVAFFASYRRKKDYGIYDRPLLETDPEVIIVGSGTAGSALATVLARDGRRVTVIERSFVPPRRIVGEYLHAGGIKAAEELGLDSCFDDFEWVPTRGMAIHDHKLGVTKLTYPDGLEGKGFFNRAFVLALRGFARKEPTCTYIEGNVTRLIKDNGVVKGVVYKTKDEEEEKELLAPLTVVADGHFSRLRKGIVNGHVQKLTHYATVLYEGVSPFPPGYIGAVVTPDSLVTFTGLTKKDTRIVVLLDRDTCGDLKEYLLSITPYIPEQARDVYLSAMETGTIESCLCQTLVASPSMEPGVLTLGDAFSMCHPITAAGMTVALNDVIFWRRELRGIPDLRDYNAVLKAQRVFIRHRKKYSFAANINSIMMYGTFTPQDDLGRDVLDYTMRYIQRGGECHDAPARVFALTDTRVLPFLWMVCRMTKSAMEMAMKDEPRVLVGLRKASTILYNTITGLTPLIWAELKTAFVF